MKNAHIIAALARLGFYTSEIKTLCSAARRASGYFERLACGEIDEEENGPKRWRVFYNNLGDEVGRQRCPDWEASLERKASAVLCALHERTSARYFVHVQRDPRGAPLYIVPVDAGDDYSKGVAVY